MADARSGAELADYSKVAFSVGGVRQEISIDDWRNGWRLERKTDKTTV